MNELPPPDSTASPGSPDALWLRETPGLNGPASSDSTLLPPPWAGMPAYSADRGAGPMIARRFAALSTLPESLRLPPKRDALPARHQRSAMALPDPGAGVALSPPPKRLPDPVGPVMLPAATARQLGFNCPACFAVLIIKDPSTYDGRPAPCPTCGIRILPPQCVPASPFSIVRRASLPAAPGVPRLPG